MYKCQSRKLASAFAVWSCFFWDFCSYFDLVLNLFLCMIYILRLRKILHGLFLSFFCSGMTMASLLLGMLCFLRHFIFYFCSYLISSLRFYERYIAIFFLSVYYLYIYCYCKMFIYKLLFRNFILWIFFLLYAITNVIMLHGTQFSIDFMIHVSCIRVKKEG
jgi:hypothetical protein